MKAEQQELITVKETLFRLKISRTTLYKLIREGELKSVTIGRARRIREASVSTFLERNAA